MLHQYTVNDINRQPVILKLWLYDKNKENNVNKIVKTPTKVIYNNSYTNKK